MADQDWDETLYRGSSPYYARGRLPYSPRLADALLALSPGAGPSRLIDVGCGPGIVALSVAHVFDEVLGVDPDEGFIQVARERAAEIGATNATFLRKTAEEMALPASSFTVAALAQSFHWMDRELVARKLFAMLVPGGALVLVSDRRHDIQEQRRSLTDAPHPMPPWSDIAALVANYLGADRRAGQRVLRNGTLTGEGTIIAASGFAGPEHVVLPDDRVFERTARDLVASVYSNSGSAPHLFGDQLDRFENELRALLLGASPSGLFAVAAQDNELMVWRRPDVS